MKKFILKTTSIFMSLAMVALIGAPAYATAAEDEPEQFRPEFIESILPDIASEKSTLAVDIQAEETKETELPPAVCDHGEEEFAEESEEAEDETDNVIATPTDPVISEDDILDFIGSEEIQDELEDAGVDSDVIEEEIEDGNYEIIYITQEEYEQMRKSSALSLIAENVAFLGESVLTLLLIPAAPIFIVVPIVGPIVLLAALASPFLTLASLGLTVISPVLAILEYKNYELEPGYVIVDEK